MVFHAANIANTLYYISVIHINVQDLKEQIIFQKIKYVLEQKCGNVQHDDTVKECNDLQQIQYKNGYSLNIPCIQHKNY